MKEGMYKMKRIFCIILSAVLCAAVLAGCSFYDSSEWFTYGNTEKTEETAKNTAAADETATAEIQPTEAPENSESREVPSFNYGDSQATYSVAEVYKNNVNAVVGITTESTTKNIFGQVSSTSCCGTGIIISSEGYILTNNHVIEDGTSYTVALYDGTVCEAELVGTEAANDVAVLKIEASGLKAATIGDSSTIIVGEDVIVIGNPLGELTYTLTRGVISALNRAINTDGTPINMFQIDAAVNSGNSGGPAFDACGNVIGMVTAKYSSSGVEGIGFCIPINDAMSVAEQLIEFGYVKGKAAMGVGVTVAYSRSFWGSTKVSGAYVSYVISGSAADKAGITEGMLINYLDNTTITSPDDLATCISGMKAGTAVTVKGYYNNAYFEKSIILDEYTPDLVPDNWNSANGTIV